MKYENYLIAKTNQLAKSLKRKGSPVDTAEAAELWGILSSSLYLISNKNSIKLYHKAGYKHFEGYPLTKLTR